MTDSPNTFYCTTSLKKFGGTIPKLRIFPDTELRIEMLRRGVHDGLRICRWQESLVLTEGRLRPKDQPAAYMGPSRNAEWQGFNSHMRQRLRKNRKNGNPYIEAEASAILRGCSQWPEENTVVKFFDNWLSSGQTVMLIQPAALELIENYTEHQLRDLSRALRAERRQHENIINQNLVKYEYAGTVLEQLTGGLGRAQIAERVKTQQHAFHVEITEERMILKSIDGKLAKISDGLESLCADREDFCDCEDECECCED